MDPAFSRRGPQRMSGAATCIQQHLPRVTEIVLSAPESTLAKLTTGMTEAAPRLETLILHSQTSEIVLPKQFLEGGGAPQLRHLILTGARIFAVTTGAIIICDVSCVSDPRTHPKLCIFLTRQSHHANEDHAPPSNTIHRIPLHSSSPRFPGRTSSSSRVQAARTELPALTQLIYRGVSAYIEALLSRIRSPRLETSTLPSSTNSLSTSHAQHLPPRSRLAPTRPHRL
jgi:hypothetical protein